MDAAHKQKSLQFKKTMDVSLTILLFKKMVAFYEILCCVSTFSCK